MKLINRILGLSLTVLLSYSVNSAQLPTNISPQQIAQFKKLSPAQQKSLAQSMGVDLNVIQSQMQQLGADGSNQADGSPLQQYYPRGTQFDEFGNPILQDQLMLEEEEDDDGKPKPYGYDVFSNAPLSFVSPSNDLAVPEHYILGPKDVISLQIFGKESYEYQLPVTSEGKVVVPELGPFNIAGLTFEEAKKFLAHQIKNKILGVDVFISLTELRSLRVFVSGEAFKPGPYILSSLSSITHAIFAAGGINDIGSLRNIQLKRAGKLITKLDLYDLLIRGDSANDIMLKSGDVIFIAPVGDQVTIDGEIKRPAIYELNGTESFAEVLKMAGGLLPSAYPSSTVVERFNSHNLRTIVNVDLSKKIELASKVKAGDTIKVMKTSEQVEESVTIIGAVSRPGNYQWKKDQRISDLLPNIHAYLAQDADLTYSLVIRQKDIGRNIEVHQFSLFNALADKSSTDNILLQRKDKVLIFSNIEEATSNLLALDQFALTKQELIDREKEEAEAKFEDRMFWQEFGDNSDILIDEEDEAEKILKQTYQSIDELTGSVGNQELELRELGFFSRKRLLAPVIEQLKRQAASGQPIQMVEIDGAVKYPGIYPLSVNARANHLIKAAGGLLESAYLVKAEITRNQVTDLIANKQTLNFNLKAALLADEYENIQLRSKDRLNVHYIPAWQDNHIVELRGEFKFPGKYTIQRGETLGDLIERVGGFTDYAYTQASLFTRQKLKELELKNLVKVSESLRMEIASKSLAGAKSVDYKQAKLLLADLTKVKPVGRLVVDIPQILSSDEFDIQLENGDMLFVPPKQDSVNVVGQVQVATSHIFREGLSAQDYIDLSGGIQRQADDDRIYVIKANGAVEIPNAGNWFAEGNHRILPGDTVVVPLDSAYMSNLTLWSTVSRIIYQGAVAIAAIQKL